MNYRSLLAATIASAGSATSPQVIAQENQREAFSALAVEEVVVTAQRRAQSANNIPISINTFTGDKMEALGVVETKDIAAIVPGFTAADGGDNTPIYTLRGVGFNDASYTASSTVGVYMDEFSLPYSIMTKGSNLVHHFNEIDG